MKPRIVILLSGGIVQQVFTEVETDVVIIDLDDYEKQEIDGQPSYVYRGDPVEVDPERTDDLFRQAGRAT